MNCKHYKHRGKNNKECSILVKYAVLNIYVFIYCYKTRVRYNICIHSFSPRYNLRDTKTMDVLLCSKTKCGSLRVLPVHSFYSSWGLSSPIVLENVQRQNSRYIRMNCVSVLIRQEQSIYPLKLFSRLNPCPNPSQPCPSGYSTVVIPW